MSSKDCGCGNNSTSEQNQNPTAQQVVPPHDGACRGTFNQEALGVAEVVVRPNIVTKNVTTRCIGNPQIVPRNYLNRVQEECRFVVAQRICTDIDIKFGAEAEVVQSGLVCGMPDTGPCPGEPPVDGCTYSFGFYRNNPDFTSNLIETLAPGGQIVLGIAGGNTIVATPENANAILRFNPPAPAPNIQIYRVLYAQLLAANLNVLRTAECPFALDAIQAANEFLASGIISVDQASAVQEPLDRYNRGLVLGCPPHCPDDEFLNEDFTDN